MCVYISRYIQQPDSHIHIKKRKNKKYMTFIIHRYMVICKKNDIWLYWYVIQNLCYLLVFYDGGWGEVEKKCISYYIYLI